MGVVLAGLLFFAAFVAALVCGIVAFVRTGDVLQRIQRLEVEVRDLTRRISLAPAEAGRPRPVHAPDTGPPESAATEPSRTEPFEPGISLAQTPPPVPKSVREARPAEAAPLTTERSAPVELPRAVAAGPAQPSGAPPSEQPAFQLELPEKMRDLTRNLSWEMLAGTKGLLWAGVITLVVGVAFFLKYLYDLGYIDERIRLAIAAAGGAAALAFGERFRRKDWAVISQGFTGLGVAVFYVCVYFSFQIYALTGQTVSFMLASCITALAVALAVVQNAPPIAVLAVIGGFLSPVFISTGENHPYGLFSYIALLDLVAAGVAWFKRWRFLDVLCFVGTALLYTGWYFKFFGNPDEPDMTLPATLYASLFYILFLGSSSVHSLVRLAKSRPEDLIVAALNAAFWFFGYYNALYAGHRYLLGGMVLGQAALAFLVFLAWRKRIAEDNAAHAVLLVVAMGLSVLAVPILLELYAYQIAWAVQGAVFVYLGYRYRHDLAVVGGIVAWTLGAVALFRTLPLHTEVFIPVFNPEFGSWASVIAAGAVITLIISRTPDEGRPGKLPMIGFVGLAGLALTCLLLTFETALFWSTREYANYQAYQHSTLAFLWAVIPVAVIAFLCQKRLFNWLIVAIACYGIALVFWFAGLAHYRLVEPWMFLNTSFLARLMLVGSLAAAAALVFRFKGETGKNAPFQASSRQLTGLLALVSCLMGAFLLSLEVWTFWELRQYAYGAVYQAGSLTLLWAAILLATTYVVCRKRLEDWIPLVLSVCTFAILVFLALLVRYRMADMYLFWNVSFALRLPMAGALAAAAWLIYRARMNGRLFGGPPFPILKIAAVCGFAAYEVGALLLTLDVWSFWEVRQAVYQYNHQYGSLVILWSVIALATAAVIYAKRLQSWTFLLVAAYAVGICIFVLSLHRYQVPETYLVLNTTYLARLTLPLSIWAGAHLLRRRDSIAWSDLTTVAGHVVFAILSAFELWFWSRRTDLVSDKMALSFISSAWGLQAFSLIAIGMILRSRTQRLLGLAFFALTIGKVWLVDLSSVEPLYRILSFIGVGLLLLPASVLYQRFSDKLLGESSKKEDGAPTEDAPAANSGESDHGSGPTAG
ncbi:MAG TPA: DUF2339 domain-containing protein [Candidatus Hydrogenedentes bacterium]|nr:DUF2339 domain-containing protein [Candidatus Hydrogenedentota bacterium]